MENLLPPGIPREPDDGAARHATIASWFLGPKAENADRLQDFFRKVVQGQAKARVELYPEDPRFITEEIQSSDAYQQGIRKLAQELSAISHCLSKHSVPFWSTRYNGHMNMDTSMPATIGYLTAMLYNPNNVALEASPLTTIIEMRVGDQLCKMLGYNIKAEPTSVMPRAWGHITCGGSIANLESLWSARNMKFYPLSLRMAINQGQLGFLNDATPPFNVKLATGIEKPFKDCSVWELLNLKPQTILDIPNALFAQYGVTQTFLTKALTPYLIQTLGKEALEKEFDIKKPGRMFVACTKHYSWPKSAAILGIGSGNCIDVGITFDARMDIKDLRKKLDECLAKQIAVFSVVAILGSTEHGAVDPLKDIQMLRTEFQEKGLSFYVHCDAAWGGYFASMLRTKDMTREAPILRYRGNHLNCPVPENLVPTLCLKEHTIDQIDVLGNADSITIDPHKSGYCPYPAGALCYRDARTRFLVTWSSPYISREGEGENIGVYGVEGSKPGASSVGTYLSHKVLGLNATGYGALLGEATFTCTKFYCHWATMSDDKSNVIVVPLNLLPAEREGLPPAQIEEQKKFIRDKILHVSNAEIAKDPVAMRLLRDLGSDLMINTFACNFRINGQINDDIVEANYLNARIMQRLSVSDVKHVVKDRPLIITSTEFSQEKYGECLTKFKGRLGLKGDQDLVALINVTMSPWPTVNDFVKKLAGEFTKVANEEVQASIVRNTITPAKHGFVMQGTDTLYLVCLPMFNLANHRQQLIISAELPADAMGKYIKDKAAHPAHHYCLTNTENALLEDLLKPGASFNAKIERGAPEQDDTVNIVENVEVKNIRILRNNSLASRALDARYPELMPFYLYGTPEQQHVDHLLRVSPNVQLNSDQVTLKLANGACPSADQLKKGLVVVLTNVRERIIQPLERLKQDEGPHPNMEFHSHGLVFAPKRKFPVVVYDSFPIPPHTKPLYEGEITLGASTFANDTILNSDPTRPPPKAPPKKKDVQKRRDFFAGIGYALPKDPLEFMDMVSAPQQMCLPGVPAEHKARQQHECAQGWRAEWKKALTVARDKNDPADVWELE